MLLLNNRPQILSFPVSFTSGMVHKHIDLLPGVNEVSAETAKQMQEHPVLKHSFEDGTLELLEEAGKGDDLSKLKPNKAKELIKATVNEELLNKWLASEKRPEVTKAINTQIEELNKPSDKKED